MKLFSVLIVGMMIAVVGCSSTPTTYAKSSSARPATKVETDYEYVAAVNRATRDRGITVKWVNPPVKRVPVKQEKKED
mgnify:CR=1 FL=1